MFHDRRSRTFLDSKVVSRLAAVPLFARRPMQGNVSGRHPSPHRGSSVEFAEYRKYVPGDDLRRLDWRAFGRSDRFVGKALKDRRQNIVLATKVHGPMGNDPNQQGNSRRWITHAVEASLRRLQT